MSLLRQPQVSAFGQAEWDQSAAERETGFGQYLGAKLPRGFDNSLAGRAVEAVSEPLPAMQAPQEYTDEFGRTFTPPMPSVPSVQPGQPGRTPIGEDDWKQSPFFREGIAYDPSMTEEIADARAQAFDRRRWRDSVIARYQGGVAGQIVGFGAEMLGGAVSPENFVPFVGPGMRAAAVARLGVIGGRALTSAADATIGTALADAVILPDLARRGEDVGIADFALDLALGAAVGGVFGVGGGLLERRQLMREAARATRIDGIQSAIDQLNVVADAIAHDEPIPAIVGIEARLRQRMLGGAATVAPWQGEARAAGEAPFPGAGVTEVSTIPERRAGLAGWLVRQGGLRDDEGELRAMDMRLQRPGLVSNRGMSLDEAARAAWEAGYIGHPDERPGEQDLLDALDDELREGPRLGTEEQIEFELATKQRDLELELAGIERELERVAGEQGHGPLSGTELAVARALVHEQEMDLDDALVEALTHAALRDDEGRLLDAAGLSEDDFDIPFGDVAGRSAAGAGERAGQPGADRPGAAGRGGEAGRGPVAGAYGTRAGGGVEPGAGVLAAGGTEAGAAPDLRGRSAEAIAAFVRQLRSRETATAVATEREPPLPASVLEAAKRAGKRPADEAAALKELAQDMGVLPKEGGDIPEMADVNELRRQGRVRPEEEADLTRADELVKEADGWAEAYTALSTCVLRYEP
jgi:hypothetical protein